MHPRPRLYETKIPTTGDLALVHDPDLIRGQWKLAEMVDSEDDFKRSAELRLPAKRIISRLNNLIYNLKLSSVPQKRQQLPTKSSSSVGSPGTHPMRISAKYCHNLSEHFFLVFCLLYFPPSQRQTHDDEKMVI
ncbi:hypothetical protein KIN20_021711 [Parelaphostrongylus tenuis]|uniref:DUF5641 domain-containing protein n=1 Tax=Parelaphostrongylus tenuis TaxID=148309 RepID=A0AAD5N4T9_PARTN|nr:hypothetical protein KIN20_021710 [Parelaphostrongylus tenuis]KAJ1362226.1 hypothetical protein KIN20_021711 [Parelaphostrongylus tenuis]